VELDPGEDGCGASGRDATDDGEHDNLLLVSTFL
jgi:hypothetical protein